MIPVDPAVDQQTQSLAPVEAEPAPTLHAAVAAVRDLVQPDRRTNALVLAREYALFVALIWSSESARAGINVVLNGCRLLIPDLAVINAPGLDAVCCTADELVLAVEVISPSSRVYDNAAKRQLYAEADVPFLMVVDPDTDPVSAIAYELRGDEYREMARSRRGVLRLDLPFAARVDFTRSGR